MDVTVTHDKEVDAAYIYLVPIGPGEAVTQVVVDDEDDDYEGTVILDFDRQRRLIGIEILDASKVLPSAILEAAHAPGEHGS